MLRTFLVSQPVGLGVDGLFKSRARNGIGSTWRFGMKGRACHKIMFFGLIFVLQGKTSFLSKLSSLGSISTIKRQPKNTPQNSKSKKIISWTLPIHSACLWLSSRYPPHGLPSWGCWWVLHQVGGSGIWIQVALSWEKWGLTTWTHIRAISGVIFFIFFICFVLKIMFGHILEESNVLAIHIFKYFLTVNKPICYSVQLDLWLHI